MGDNKTFRVNVQTSTSKKINVTSNVSENYITASPDTGLYYSRLSEKWAIGEGLVENKDYSSKTYATQAKEYAEESKMYSESANLDLNNVENKITEYNAQLDEIVAEGLANITSAESNAIGNIETSIAGIDAEVQVGKSEINTLKTQAVNDINTKTNQSITSIENKTQEGIEKIEAAGGGSAENAVTTNTEQTITANKTFTEGKQVKFLTGRSGYNGAVYGDTNQEGNVILECQNDSGNIPESVIVGAQGFGSNYTRRGIFLSHPSNEAVYVGYPNYACKIQGENDLKLYGGYKQNSYLTLSNDSVTYTKSNGDTVNLLSGGGSGDYVLKSGDTMTGTLTLQDVLNIKRSNTLDYTDTNHTTVSETAGEIYFRDKNDEVVGYVQAYFNQYNNMVLATSARRSINGTTETAQTQLYVDVKGNANFTFPTCTTKATTTSSASTGRVAVIVQNYVSGTSWYRVWSDGWIEQGGRFYSSSDVVQTINLLKNFSNTNYVAISTPSFNEDTYISNVLCIRGRTTSSFKIISSSNVTKTYFDWHACGY